jgi:hypothetical protein
LNLLQSSKSLLPVQIRHSTQLHLPPLTCPNFHCFEANLCCLCSTKPCTLKFTQPALCDCVIELNAVSQSFCCHVLCHRQVIHNITYIQRPEVPSDCQVWESKIAHQRYCTVADVSEPDCCSHASTPTSRSIISSLPLRAIAC